MALGRANEGVSAANSRVGAEITFWKVRRSEGSEVASLELVLKNLGDWA